jgi:3-dehydroshikimate dehydratase
VELAFCSISALDRPLAAAAALAASVGLDGLEVTARPPHLDPEAPLEAIAAAGRAVRDAGLAVVAYGSYLGREGPRTPERARREVAVARALGAPRIRVWAEPDASADAEGFAGAVELLRAACDAAAADGIDVVVERHVGSLADTPARIERLLAAVRRPNLALNYQVLDFLPPAEASHQPDDARRLVPHARYFHLKNYRTPEPPGTALLPGGSLAAGAIDVRALLAAALGAGYRGPLTIEFLSFEPLPVEEKLRRDAAFVRGVLRELGA